MNTTTTQSPVLNVSTSIPNTRTDSVECPTLELTAEQVPLWYERKQWSDKLNEATRNLARIDKALALPKYENKAQTVIVKGPCPVESMRRGKRVVQWVVKVVGQIAVSFVAPELTPRAGYWRNTKSVSE